MSSAHNFPEDWLAASGRVLFPDPIHAGIVRQEVFALPLLGAPGLGTGGQHVRTLDAHGPLAALSFR